MCSRALLWFCQSNHFAGFTWGPGIVNVDDGSITDDLGNQGENKKVAQFNSWQFPVRWCEILDLDMIWTKTLCWFGWPRMMQLERLHSLRVVPIPAEQPACHPNIEISAIYGKWSWTGAKWNQTNPIWCKTLACLRYRCPPFACWLASSFCTLFASLCEFKCSKKGLKQSSRSFWRKFDEIWVRTSRKQCSSTRVSYLALPLEFKTPNNLNSFKSANRLQTSSNKFLQCLFHQSSILSHPALVQMANPAASSSRSPRHWVAQPHLADSKPWN